MCDFSPVISKINSFDFLCLEAKRLFHGRGGLYFELENITIDWLSGILFIRSFKEDNDLEKKIIEVCLELCESPVVLHQKHNDEFRYFRIGEEECRSHIAEHLGLKFILKIGRNQNYGIFLDMDNGKKWIKENCLNKKVLNLFSYTCAISVVAKSGGAKEVHNVDMSSNVLSWGRENHRVNNLDMNGVFFHKKNIMKSLGRISKIGPYDIILIDPPTFQKGSFDYRKEYLRIVKRLDEMTSHGGYILACLNTPFETSNYIVSLFKDNLDNFKLVETLYSSKEYEEEDKEKGLKIVIFKKDGNV